MRAVSKFIKLQVDVTRVPRVHEPPEAELTALALEFFKKFDKNADAVLDAGEFREMLIDVGVSHACLHKNVIDQYIRNLDLNHDKLISFHEFMVGYKSLLKWDRERFSLRAPLQVGDAKAEDSPQRVVEDSRKKTEASPLDNCPRSDVAPVMVGDVEFLVPPRYKLGALLGRGAYGVIAAATDVQTGERVVVKRLAAYGHPIELQATLRELLILRHIRRHPHDNLLGLNDLTPPPEGSLDAWRALYLVLPRMDCDLHAIIHSSQTLTADHCQFFAYQLLRGLLALHSANVVHRDLKPSNLLVNRDCTLRIADFGISRSITASDSSLTIGEETAANAGVPPPPSRLTNYVVTRYYRAPELLLESAHYGFAVDNWSVGCIVAEMLLRRPLLCGQSATHQLELIADILGPPSAAEQDELLSRHGSSAEKMKLLAVCPRGVAEEEWLKRGPHLAELCSTNSTIGVEHTGAIDLVNGMLRYLPSARTLVADALEHPWLRELHECNDEPRLPPVLFPAVRTTRKQLQLAAIETTRELHAGTRDVEQRA
ncbi:kinase-like domain-containing protein [Pavlovales sp. CCMP2436]|nr:kinase-like domain-containing protein [Pavlovales sp. CCMP2436]